MVSHIKLKDMHLFQYIYQILFHTQARGHCGIDSIVLFHTQARDRCGIDGIVVGFTTTCEISAYHI